MIFPLFTQACIKIAPRIETEIRGLYLAGDWVKMDNCTMLMEAAYTSGAIAANHIMAREGYGRTAYKAFRSGVF